MMRSIIVPAILCCSSLVWAQPASKTPPLSTLEQKAGYAIGHDFGSSLAKQGFTPDFQALITGISDALAGKKSQLPPEQSAQAMKALQEMLAGKEKQRVAEMQKKNATFLAENKKQAGVLALPSGLQYKVIKPGSGNKPKATDSVTVHYVGKLIDGTEFDSSVARGQPATFPLNRVIPGWTEGVQLMPLGAKYMFYIPGNLAYGDSPPPGSSIYPNAVLVFEVELLKIGQ